MTKRSTFQRIIGTALSPEYGPPGVLCWTRTSVNERHRLQSFGYMHPDPSGKAQDVLTDAGYLYAADLLLGGGAE